MKLGKIKISDTIMTHERVLEFTLPLMSVFLPIHIEIRPHMKDYVYTGISEHFEELPEAFEIPFYEVTMDTINKTIQLTKL